MIGLQKWWRVEKDKTGAILSCKEVEASETGSKLVCFVEAIDAAEAVRKAAEWHSTVIAKTRARAKADFDHRKSIGLCVHSGCKQRAVEDRTRCAAHLEYNSKAGIRHRAGESKRQATSPVEQFEKHKANQKKSYLRRGGSRATTLRVVLQKIDSQPLGEVRAWLVSEISRLEQKGLRNVPPGVVKLKPKQAIDWFEDIVDRKSAAE
jgi:hypothetical protein